MSNRIWVEEFGGGEWVYDGPTQDDGPLCEDCLHDTEAGYCELGVEQYPLCVAEHYLQQKPVHQQADGPQTPGEALRMALYPPGYQGQGGSRHGRGIWKGL